jgi:hypothetical protein
MATFCADLFISLLTDPPVRTQNVVPSMRISTRQANVQHLPGPQGDDDHCPVVVGRARRVRVQDEKHPGSQPHQRAGRPHLSAGRVLSRRLPRAAGRQVFHQQVHR